MTDKVLKSNTTAEAMSVATMADATTRVQLQRLQLRRLSLVEASFWSIPVTARAKQRPL